VHTDRLGAWLLDAGAAAASVDELALGFRDELVSSGIPVGFFNVGMFVLHPEIAAVALSGSSTGRLDRIIVEHAALSSPAFRTSPLRIVTEERRALEFDLEDRVASTTFPVLEEFRSKGFVRYYAWPLPARHGPCSILSLALANNDEQAVRAIERTLPLLSVVLELHAARYLKQILLRTYVGERSAREVLAGRFRRGDHQELEAVLWLSDVRSFTDLTQHYPAADVVRWLDQVFDALAEPVQRGGGEILKFIGDAMLAIFPVDEIGGRAEACAVALEAAREAQSRVREAAARAEREGRPALRTGIAMHLGDVVYGNVGAKNRLDFTVIGDAVNRVARIESVAREAPSGIVMSAEFVRHVSAPTDALGRFSLKGYDEPIDVFTVELDPPTRR
jgi:adenylate cyclase